MRQLRRIYIIDTEELQGEEDYPLVDSVKAKWGTVHGISVEPIRETQSHIIIQDNSVKEGTLLSTTPMPWIPDGSKVEIIFEATSKNPDDAEDGKAKLTSP